MRYRFVSPANHTIKEIVLPELKDYKDAVCSEEKQLGGHHLQMAFTPIVIIYLKFSQW